MEQQTQHEGYELHRSILPKSSSSCTSTAAACLLAWVKALSVRYGACKTDPVQCRVPNSHVRSLPAKTRCPACLGSNTRLPLSHSECRVQPVALFRAHGAEHLWLYALQNSEQQSWGSSREQSTPLALQAHA